MPIARRTMVILLALAFAFVSDARAAGDVGASPQAKAYGAMLKTVQSGDYEAYKKCHTKAVAEKIDQQTKEMKMDPKKMMEFMKEMTPKDLKFAGLKVDGKKATLDATGKVGDEPNKGTIVLEEEGGQWKVVSESWTNAK